MNTNGVLFDVKLYLTDLESRFDKINRSEYYLSYSGGKDSHFLYWFIKEYLKDNDIKIVGCNTFLEHNQIRERILEYCDEVVYPNIKPKELKEKYGIPCFSKGQDEFIKRYQNGSRSYNTLKYVERRERSTFNLNRNASYLTLSGKLHKVSNRCCDYFKKKPLLKYERASKRKAILGVRSSESKNRANAYKSCFTKDKKFTPIHDLSNDLLNQIYLECNIPLPKLYNVLHRTGCMGCPYGKNIELELSLIENVNQKNFIIDFFKESYDVKGINYISINDKN